MAAAGHTAAAGVSARRSASRGRPPQTDAGSWVQAALETIEEEGLAGLSVQAVARRLGVSKGGFYHRFHDRRELLVAALGEWERSHAVEMAERFEEIADPRERLRALLRHAALELEPTVIAQLMAAPGDADVAAALRRAARVRMGLLERLFGELGLPPAAARRRAVLAYSAYLGLVALRVQVPGVLDGRRATLAYLRSVEAALLAPAASGF